jgi:hypothetical protein
MNFRLVGSVLLLVYLALQSQTPETQFTVVSDVQYCTGGSQPLLMDVFIPKNRIRRPTPAILWIHGGGWERGDKNGNSGALLLADEGFVTASLFYRLSGDSPFPADIEDCKCAFVSCARTRRSLASILIELAWRAPQLEATSPYSSPPRRFLRGSREPAAGEIFPVKCKPPPLITEPQISQLAPRSFSITLDK